MKRSLKAKILKHILFATTLLSSILALARPEIPPSDYCYSSNSHTQSVPMHLKVRSVSENPVYVAAVTVKIGENQIKGLCTMDKQSGQLKCPVDYAGGGDFFVDPSHPEVVLITFSKSQKAHRQEELTTASEETRQQSPIQSLNTSGIPLIKVSCY